MKINHQDNFGTNITSNQSSGVTTTPLNAIPFIQPPFWIALDATNINGKYEPVLVTSKTATNINHSATLYPHTTAEEVRMVVPSAEFDDISSSMTDGWVGIIGTLTAATATTINTSVDLTSVIQKGDKLKLINSSSTKYFYVVSLTSTVITVTGEVDLVAGAITSPQYSKIANPQGFKVAMPYTPTLTGLTLGNGTVTAYITIIGNFVTVNITILCGSTTTFSSNNTISIPVTAIGVVNYSFLRSAIQRYIGSSIPGLLVSGGTNLQLASSTVIGSFIAEAVVTSTVPFTWGVNDSISAIFTGRII